MPRRVVQVAPEGYVHGCIVRHIDQTDTVQLLQVEALIRPKLNHIVVDILHRRRVHWLAESDGNSAGDSLYINDRRRDGVGAAGEVNGRAGSLHLPCGGCHGEFDRHNAGLAASS